MDHPDPALPPCPSCRSQSTKFLLYIRETGLNHYRCDACGSNWTDKTPAPQRAPARPRVERA